MARQTEKSRGIRVRDVPQDLLDRGRDMVGVARDVWLAGLGVFAVVGEEGGHLFDRLVESGEELEKRGRMEISERQKEITTALEEQVYEPLISALRRFGVTTRAEMQEVADRLDRITNNVDALVTRVGKGEGARGTLQVYRVFAEDRGWAVGRNGEADAVAVHPTKDEALEKARELARSDHPSRLDVYRKDGELQDSFEF